MLAIAPTKGGLPMVRNVDTFIANLICTTNSNRAEDPRAVAAGEIDDMVDHVVAVCELADEPELVLADVAGTVSVSGGDEVLVPDADIFVGVNVAVAVDVEDAGALVNVSDDDVDREADAESMGGKGGVKLLSN